MRSLNKTEDLQLQLHQNSRCVGWWSHYLPPDPNDLNIFTQNILNGVIEYTESTLYNNFGGNRLKQSSCRHKTHLRCTRGEDTRPESEKLTET